MFDAVGVVANKGDKEKTFLSKLGEEIGLLFQLADDFLDKRVQVKLLASLLIKIKKVNQLY